MCRIVGADEGRGGCGCSAPGPFRFAPCVSEACEFRRHLFVQVQIVVAFLDGDGDFRIFANRLEAQNQKIFVRRECFAACVREFHGARGFGIHGDEFFKGRFRALKSQFLRIVGDRHEAVGDVDVFLDRYSFILAGLRCGRGNGRSFGYRCVGIAEVIQGSGFFGRRFFCRSVRRELRAFRCNPGQDFFRH